MHVNHTFRRNANRAGTTLSSLHGADGGELAWSDINQMAWDYTNTVIGRKHDFPHQENSEMILCGFHYAYKICDTTVLEHILNSWTEGTYPTVSRFIHISFHFPGISHQVLHAAILQCCWIRSGEDGLDTTRKEEE